MNMPIPYRVLTQDSMKDYLHADAVSSSGLVQAARSMRAYRNYCEYGSSFDSAALALGTAMHTYLEGGWSLFHEHYILKPEDMDRRTKAGKERYAEFQIEAGAKQIIDGAAMAQIEGMADALENCDDPLIQLLLSSDGHREVSCYWSECDMPQKARTDRYIQCDEVVTELLAERYPILFAHPIRNLNLVLDLKTTQDASSDNWRNIIRYGRYGYPLKAAHYLEGFDCDGFCWLAVESRPPHEIGLYWMCPSREQEMREKRKALLTQIASCIANNEWPSAILTEQESVF